MRTTSGNPDALSMADSKSHPFSPDRPDNLNGVFNVQNTLQNIFHLPENFLSITVPQFLI
jgi:hypothetical protein